MMKKKAIGFLQLSQVELNAAKHLYDGKFDAQAFYLVSQSTEKVVRALAEEAGVLIGNTHSFERMAAAFPDDHPFKSRIRDYDELLSSASTRTRYVTDSGNMFVPGHEKVVYPSIIEAQEFINSAKSFLLSGEFKNTLKR
jgi:HEPN domain-containing protein